MKNFRYLIALFILAFAFVSCSSTKLDQESVKQVKKVGVVGIEVIQEMLGESDGPSMGNGARQESEHVKTIFDGFINSIHKNKSWKALSYNKITSNAYYFQQYKNEMKGLRSVPPPGANREVFSAPKLMDQWAISRMTKDQKNLLCRKLGVDAIAYLRIQSDLKAKASLLTLVGGGNVVPDARVQIELYSLAKGEVIWRESALAKTSSDGAKHWAGISKKDAINKLVVESSKLSFEELFKKLK
ncbi:hypothetical protein GW915_03235 [bacterium]|nr:hypothetical protein [bacterium]